jgi:hypothetical protein
MSLPMSRRFSPRDHSWRAPRHDAVEPPQALPHQESGTGSRSHSPRPSRADLMTLDSRGRKFRQVAAYRGTCRWPSGPVLFRATRPRPRRSIRAAFYVGGARSPSAHSWGIIGAAVYLDQLRGWVFATSVVRCRRKWQDGRELLVFLVSSSKGLAERDSIGGPEIG